jgi:hypothetical protein
MVCFLGRPRFRGWLAGAPSSFAGDVAFRFAVFRWGLVRGVVSKPMSDVKISFSGDAEARAPVFRPLAGVPALLRVVGIGVPDFRGRPLRLGVALPVAGPSSSLKPRRGTVVVVVVVAVSLRGVARRFGVGDWKRRRLVLRVVWSSASTVTRRRCGERSLPTSSSKVCFLGEGASTVNRRSEAWLFFLMCEGGIMGGLRTGSIKGSGDDPRSSVMVRSSSIAAGLLSPNR